MTDKERAQIVEWLQEWQSGYLAQGDPGDRELSDLIRRIKSWENEP